MQTNTNENPAVKKKKSIFKKWWFWLIVILAVAIVGASSANDSGTTNGGNSQGSSSDEIVYEKVDLQTMFDDLENNAMSAEQKYQNKYIEVEGKISNFDSDGEYISIEPISAGTFNLDTMMCYIKNDNQRQIIMQKSKGDTVTVKCKVKSIGEVLGYSVNINEIK